MIVMGKEESAAHGTKESDELNMIVGKVAQD